MSRGNVHFQRHARGYFAFKRLLRCSDDKSLPLVEKSAIRWVFGPHPPLNRQGPDRQLFFCAAFTSCYEESDRGQTITAKKTTKSLISNQKTQEYIKSKCPLFIL